MFFLNREDATEYINAHPEVVFSRARTDVQGKPSYICPICGNGSGESGTGLVSQDGKHWKCFKCGYYGDVIDYIGKTNNINNYADMFELARGLYGITITGERTTGEPQRKSVLSNEEAKKTPTDYREYVIAHRGGDTSYLQARGLSPEIIQKHGYGYDADKNAVVIPYTNNGTTGVQVRYTNIPEQGKGMRYQNLKGSTWGIFNEQALYGTDPVFITEGAIDASSIEEVGGTAVAIISADNADKFLQYIKNNRTTAPYYFISLDNDSAGQSATQKIEQGLKAQNIPCSVFFQDINAHDINRALQTEKTALQTKVLEALEMVDTRTPEQIEIDNHRVRAILPVFNKYVRDENNNKPIPTGFPGIDERIGGGLLPRFYIIGASPTIGKTTLVLQIADNIAKAGEDVLLFSLEMSKEDIVARSISRHTYEICLREKLNTSLAKTEFGVLLGSRYKTYRQEELDLLEDAQREYAEYAEEHISIYEGKRTSEEIRAIVQKYIEVTGHTPVTIVDYLQILPPVPDMIRATEKQQVDYDINVFTAMRRELKVPVLVVSSFNRSSYNGVADMDSFKETGEIEYSCDTLMSLQYDIPEEELGKNSTPGEVRKTREAFIRARRANPRELILTFHKNRGSQTGNSVPLLYNPMFNYMEQNWTKADVI